MISARDARLTGLVFIAASVLFGADNALTQQERAEGWVLLFDGKTLKGWDSAAVQAAAAPKPAAGAAPPSAAVGSSARACSTAQGLAPAPAGASRWEVVDGLLTPCGETAGYLTSVESYSDFVLVLDFRADQDANSGVFVRSPEGTGGYEVQIWRTQPEGYNTGSIVGTARTAGEFNFLANQWNRYEITADGDRLVVVLNGVKTLDVRDPKFANGRIRLQYQRYPIEFKNIKLKPLRR